MASNEDKTDSKDLTENQPEVNNTNENEEASASNSTETPELDSKGKGQPFNWNPFKKKYIEMPVEKYSIHYNMTHKNRGMALIFNHKDFNPRLHLNTRNGTDKDRDNFKEALMTLGFVESNIKIYNDYSANKIADELRKGINENSQLKNFANMDHTNNDCVMVAIFSHGDQNVLYANDKKIRPEDLWEPFLANRCPTLAGKPKLFFIQSCQGDRLETGMNVMDKPDNSSNFYKIPITADILIHYSTTPGFYSWRNNTDGSWFIQALCVVFKKYGLQLDLLTLLTRVNQIVATHFESDVPDNPEMDKKKQIPCLTSMLTRKVFFNPQCTS